jgi:hypothetical protein
VYDMYPWNGASTASTAPTSPAASPRPRTARTTKAPKAPKAAKLPPATSAVQIALDRRDNGGDAAAEPTAALARQ